MSLKKLGDLEAKNNSFFMRPIEIWTNFIMNPSNYLPNPSKPLVFLPCGRANSTRNKKRVFIDNVAINVNKVKKKLMNMVDSGIHVDERKFISEGFGHSKFQMLRVDENLEKVILSEPCTIIPYSLEGHILRPDYELPADHLSIQDELEFIRRLASWLKTLRIFQPDRKRIYYAGGAHHFLILYYANKQAHNLFDLIYEIPSIQLDPSYKNSGIYGYPEAATRLSREIYKRETMNNKPSFSSNSKIWSKYIESIKALEGKGAEYLGVEPERVIDFFDGNGNRYDIKWFWHEMILLKRYDEFLNLDVSFEKECKKQMLVKIEKDSERQLIMKICKENGIEVQFVNVKNDFKQFKRMKIRITKTDEYEHYKVHDFEKIFEPRVKGKL